MGNYLGVTLILAPLLILRVGASIIRTLYPDDLFWVTLIFNLIFLIGAYIGLPYTVDELVRNDYNEAIQNQEEPVVMPNPGAGDYERENTNREVNVNVFKRHGGGDGQI